MTSGCGIRKSHGKPLSLLFWIFCVLIKYLYYFKCCMLTFVVFSHLLDTLFVFVIYRVSIVLKICIGWDIGGVEPNTRLSMQCRRVQYLSILYLTQYNNKKLCQLANESPAANNMSITMCTLKLISRSWQTSVSSFLASSLKIVNTRILFLTLFRVADDKRKHA
jgi:hypothetical protein